jgi:hypothetical protein
VAALLFALAAGCLGGPGQPAAAPGEPPPITMDERRVGFDFEGAFTPTVYPCAFLCAGNGRPTQAHPLNVTNRTLTSITVNLTWTASSELSQRFAVQVYHLYPVNQSNIYAKQLALRAGPSPIQIRMNDLVVPLSGPGHVSVLLGPSPAEAGLLRFWATLDQGYTMHVEADTRALLSEDLATLNPPQSG